MWSMVALVAAGYVTSPRYFADTWCVPWVRPDVVNVALPPETVPEPNTVVSSRNWTVPVTGAPPPPTPTTVAVNVTADPNPLGLGSAARVTVLVGTDAPPVFVRIVTVFVPELVVTRSGLPSPVT